MTDSQMRRFRDALRANQAVLEEKLWNRDGIDVERTADSTDEAQLALDCELKVRALSRDYSLLVAVRSALRRIEDGDYGVCQSCDGDISEKRLVAVPWASYCIDCQERVDRMHDQPERFAA